jgi:hypothetical protein
MNAPALHAQQLQFTAALLQPDLPPPDFLCTQGELVARFDVYRNNVHASLIEALQANFPVLARLVGEDSFRALAREFLRTRLPVSAALHDYGSTLPDFLRDYAPAASLPWLADVAALECAWWQAYGAADAPALSAIDLAAIDADALLARRARLHPAVRVLHFAHPAASIWLAHQVEGEPAPVPDWCEEAALLTRPDAEVRLYRITPAQRHFVAALAAGETLDRAGSRTFESHAGFDFGATLLMLAQAGALQELHR